jgi:hypothetical protein
MQVIKNEQRQNPSHQYRQQHPQSSSRTPSPFGQVIVAVKRLGSHGLTIQNMLEVATHKTLRELQSKVYNPFHESFANLENQASLSPFSRAVTIKLHRAQTE